MMKFKLNLSHQVFCFKCIMSYVGRSLTQTDSVRFNNLLTSLRSTEYAHRSSGWVLMDSAETLFVTAAKRMYDSKNGKRSIKTIRTPRSGI
jgi:hypothetical protein